MLPTRRHVLSCGLLVTLSSLSGCIGNYLPDDVNRNNTSPTDSTGNTELDPVEQTVTDRTSNLTSYTNWVADEYHNAWSDYLSDLQTARDEVTSLSEKDPENISDAELDETASLVREVGETADSVFGEHYDTWYNFGRLAERLENDIKTGLRRSEYDDVDESLSEIDRTVRYQSRRSSVEYWFPQDIVFRKPYTYFIKGDRSDTNKVFEVFTTTGANEAGLFATPAQMNLGQHPLGQQQETDSYDIGPQVFPDRESTLLEQASWLSAETDPETETYVNIIDYTLEDEEYPAQYLYGSEGTPDDYAVDDLTVPNFNQVPPLSVLIQEFVDEQTAEDALETFESMGTVDGEIQHFDQTYNKLYYIDEEAGETYYADVIQTQNYVVAVDINDEQWSNRTIENLPEEATREEYLLENTWLDTTTNEEE